MKLRQRVVRSLMAAFERHGRARTLSVLRGMDPKQLADLGFSADLLREGLSGWPWRADPAEAPAPDVATATASRAEQRAAVAELETYSDAELADLGIGRCDIANAVRNGRSGLDDLAA